MADSDSIYTEMVRHTNLLKQIADNQAETAALLRQIVMMGGLTGSAPTGQVDVAAVQLVKIADAKGLSEEEERRRGEAALKERAAAKGRAA